MTDRQPLPMNDDGELTDTADRVRELLNRQADRIEPRHDAYARLAAKVNEARPGRMTGFRSWLPTPQLVVAVSLAVVALAGGIVLVNGAGDNRPEGAASGVVENDSTTTTPDTTSTTTVTDSAVEADDGSGGTDEVIGNPGIAVALAGGLARESKAEAATAFLNHLGVDHVSVGVVGDQAHVRTEREGGGEGPEIAVLELVPVPIDNVDRWVVIEAKSDSIVIDAPLAQAKVNGDALVVSGQGTGFEAWVEVDVRAATDGRRLAADGGGAGNFGDLAPFSVTVPMVGAEQLWVVVRSSSGTDEVASAFAAVPISSTGATDTTSYRVVRIPDDDPDNGLNLRAGPGSNNAVVAVLDRGAVVTRRADAVPARNGASIWWPVTTDTGAVGWAASQYLGADGPLSDEALRDAAASFLRAAFNPDAGTGLVTGAARLGVTVVSATDQVEVSSASLRDPAGWTSPLSDLGGRSLADIANVPLDFETDLTTEVNGSTGVASAASAVLSRYFGGLPHVTLGYTDADGARRTVHVVYEAAPTGDPALVGIIFA